MKTNRYLLYIKHVTPYIRSQGENKGNNIPSFIRNLITFVGIFLYTFEEAY
jgi:hypothetical protein